MSSDIRNGQVRTGWLFGDVLDLLKYISKHNYHSEVDESNIFSIEVHSYVDFILFVLMLILLEGLINIT